jgi:hypothetical protein
MNQKEPTLGQMEQLWNLCSTFVKEHKPTCQESIFQVDRATKKWKFSNTLKPDSVSLVCLDFVTDICNCVGYEEESQT